MSRVKTFDATGIAPNGRLYAGDLNAIQDAKADQANFSQTVDLGTVRIGDTTITLIKFGTAEARLTAALRIDGILRAGGVNTGGMMFALYTTAQRDAIALGSRPQYMHIFNTTTQQLEWNSGSDAVPVWLPVASALGSVLIGMTSDWPYRHNELAANYLLPYGQAISRATYAVLHALAAAASYPHGNGDGSTTFNMPDYRGRIGVGRDDMGGSAAGRITSAGSALDGTAIGAAGGAQNITLATGNLPVHAHPLTGSPALTGTPALSGAPGLGSLGVSGAPGAGSLAVGGTTGGGGPASESVDNNLTGSTINVGGSGNTGEFSHTHPAGSLTITGAPSVGSLGVSGAPSIGTLAVGVGSLAVGIGTLASGNAGSGTAFTNVQPSIIVNKAMRVL